MDKAQLLRIDFTEDEGIILLWNYNDLKQENKFFRHFLILATDSVPEANSFVQNYIKKISPGDVYCTLY